MPILRLKNISKMSSEERFKNLSELRVELARLKTMVRAGGAVEKPGRIRELRKTIAQILTIENEYKLGIRVEKEKKVKKPKQKKTKKEKQTK
ncbi:MAG: 50S ribosomal protein L29 [Candidatus Bathyarchaeota archaeon]|nr:50S ribosomal protein L29 [Candidatus Bathyarchaeota archaeon]